MGPGPPRDGLPAGEATARLHGLLVRIALADAGRRGPRLRITGPELEDLAYQAAADALLAITAKLGQFRGESRFTTWACKFVIFEVSAKLGRHFWRHPGVPFDAEDWDRLPDRFGFEPEREAEWGDLVPALRRFLQTDPRDVGCAEAMEMLHVYADLVASGVPAQERYPGIAAHLSACGPCGQDFEALLAAIGDTR